MRENQGKQRQQREQNGLREGVLAGTRVEHCSQGISVRKATEAGRLRVLRFVCLLM